MKTKSIHFSNTIKNWDEALPLGNGDMGCLVWNSADKLRFSLDKGGIWDCSNPPENQENFTYADIQNAVRKGKQKYLNKKYDKCYNKPTPTKLPAGKMILNLGVTDPVISDLDFNTAEARISAGNVLLRTFIHAEFCCGMIEINKTGIDLTVENPAYGSERKPIFSFISRGTVQSLKNLHYPKPEHHIAAAGGIVYKYFIQQTKDIFYGIITAKTEINGKTLIAFTVGSGKSKAFIKECLKTVTGAIEAGYDERFKTHCAWWKTYWEKSSVTLPDKLLEKQWYLNNYLLASCSRKGHFPMPLQGVWTADNGSLPPWKGDYHHDLNTEMCYTSYLKANHLEQGECFIDYLLSLTDAAKNFAEKFYNADGLCLPSVMDIEGHALGGWCQYSLSPINQLWLCNIMARHYFYTKNQNYLAKIYPYLTETGKFLLSILTEKDGKYKLPLSTSPEIHDNSKQAWLTPNSNYDLALMRCFANNMINICTQANDAHAAEEWKNHLSKFDELAVNENGVLMLSPDESPYASHRHHSHCMAIYPLRTLEYTTGKNRRIIDNTIKDIEKHGRSEWVGYSAAWMAQFYIIQHRGEDACNLLHDFFHYTCTKNGFHVNGDYKRKTEYKLKYRLFTLEGNFLACDAIQEMLLYSEWGKIRLFPAVPKEWKDAEFANFRAYGGLLISAKMQNGKITYFKAKATEDTEFILENDLTCLKSDTVITDKKITLRKGKMLIAHI